MFEESDSFSLPPSSCQRGFSPILLVRTMTTTTMEWFIRERTPMSHLGCLGTSGLSFIKGLGPRGSYPSGDPWYQKAHPQQPGLVYTGCYYLCSQALLSQEHGSLCIPSPHSNRSFSLVSVEEQEGQPHVALSFPQSPLLRRSLCVC